MIKIVRIPKKVKGFFQPLRPCFSKPQWRHVQAIVLAMAIVWGKRNIQRLWESLGPDFPHRTKVNDFVVCTLWDPEAALRETALSQLKAMKPGKREEIFLILDDTGISKTGKEMEGAKGYWDHATGEYRWGHTVLFAFILFRDKLIPWSLKIYLGKDYCRDEKIVFKKLTEMAAEIIRDFQAPCGLKVTVLFDSYYLAQKIVWACVAKGFFFISTLKTNRNLWFKGRKQKVGKLGKKLLKKKTAKIVLKNGKGQSVTYRAKKIEAQIPKAGGKVVIVFSRRGKEKGFLAIVTNDLGLSEKAVLKRYAKRWWIEVFFKEGKQLLGLGDYKTRDLEGIKRHLHLVSLAFGLLTHLAYANEKGKMIKQNQRLTPFSVRKLQDDLRKLVWDDMIEHLQPRKQKMISVRKLNQLLMAA
ncbi:MAG: IS701 family transposase [Thermodesulfobacteriota bacterium]